MRHLNQARQDQYNDQLADALLKVLAPLGYQNHPKHGAVVIREVLTEKECKDITYKLLLETAKNKVANLKILAKEIRVTRARIDNLMTNIVAIEVEYPSTWYRRLRGHQERYELLLKNKDVETSRLETLNDLRMLFLSTGPLIPDEVIKEQKI